MISNLELLATFFGFIYIVLIILKKPLGWVFGVLSSLLFAQVSWESNLYIQTTLNGIYVIMGVNGFIRWNKIDSKRRNLSKNQKILIYILGIAFSFTLGFTMSYTNQALPYLDSFISIFGIVATYLTTEKHIENWIIWIFVNLSSIILFAHQELYLSACLYGAYLLLSIIGLISWNKEKIREKTI
ncbi:MAG: nicotinamide riboside transporter PnuC [Bacteroidota bacterium]